MSNLPLISFETILNEIKQYLKPSELETVSKAYELAYIAHVNQERKTGEPYIQHPLYVSLTLAKMRLDADTLAAAFLHDIVEDTPNTLADIKAKFGGHIAGLVDGVTKLDAIDQKTGFINQIYARLGLTDKPLSSQERRLESLRKMLLATSKDIRVVLIKLADRLHNMETLIGMSPEKQQALALETLEIYAPIAYRLGIGTIKGRLEDLSFAILEPAKYLSLKKRVSHEAANREHQVEKARRVILTALTKAGIKAEIHARVKHLYSLHRKLMRYKNDLSKVYDLVACRIVVDTVEECYQALGIIHKRWKPVEGRVKDYIASPKPNGYRSIHTTVKAVENRPIEIQIRTKEMHEQAERGVAAHWQYSEEKGTINYLRRRASRARQQDLSWVNELAKWQRQITNHKDLDALMKIDFFGDRIFAYTPKGEVIDLPLGATPIDFAYAIHSEIGNHLLGARVNGKMIRLQDQLRSGDVVELSVSKRSEPKPDWLNEAKTSYAKALIRRHLRTKKQ